MPTLPRRLGPVAVLAVLWASGCADPEGVSSYRAPRTVEPTGKGPAGLPAGHPEVGPTAAGGEYRILGAMYPADDPAWFLKLTGPADLVAKAEIDFDKLAATVKLRGDSAPEFALPAGWRLAGKRSIHAETARTPDGLEMTVTASRGGVAQNVGRWAGQVGQSFAAADLAKVTKPIEAAGGKGLRVDVRGPQNPLATGMAPMMGGKK